MSKLPLSLYPAKSSVDDKRQAVVTAGVMWRKQSYLYAHSLADKLLEIHWHVPIKAYSVRLPGSMERQCKKFSSQMTSV